jgi:hypothetical protein
MEERSYSQGNSFGNQLVDYSPGQIKDGSTQRQPDEKHYNL